jgi:hypothetical protein
MGFGTIVVLYIALSTHATLNRDSRNYLRLGQQNECQCKERMISTESVRSLPQAHPPYLKGWASLLNKVQGISIRNVGYSLHLILALQSSFLN